MHPFLQFPQLFFLAPLYVPVLLRLTAACAFAYLAYLHIQRREEMGKTRFMLIGVAGVWIAWVAALIEAGVTLGLLLGYYTQIAALVGLLLCIKHFVWAKKYPRIFPLCRREYVFLFIICLSLLLTGAGAFAFDLPL